MKTIIYDDYNKYDEPSGIFLGQSEGFTAPPPYAGYQGL